MRHSVLPAIGLPRQQRIWQCPLRQQAGRIVLGEVSAGTETARQAGVPGLSAAMTGGAAPASARVRQSRKAKCRRSRVM